MKFGELKQGDNIFILHSDNTLESEKISRISSNNGFIKMGFGTTDINVKADPSTSIYFDRDVDVVLFTEKHDLHSGLIER